MVSGSHRAGSDPKRAALKERIAENILGRIDQGTLPLPSIPVAAMTCLALLRRADFSMSEAAGVIEQDPTLALRVLAVSHSVAFCAKQKARTVLQSVTQLGASNLRLVLFEAMAAPIYESSDPRIRNACRALWQHSRAVASCARLGAIRTRVGDPAEAYLGGLLHDIGKPIVASLLVKAEHRLIGQQTELWLEPDAWLDVVHAIHRTVGIALVRKWELVDTVVSSVANSSTYEQGAPASIVDCVRLANALAKQEDVYAGPFDPSSVDEAVRLGKEVLDLDDDAIELFRADVRQFGAADQGAV
jgi:HD-like signal output (HDOD) protein